MCLHASEEKPEGRAIFLLAVPTTISAAQATRQAGITLRNVVKEQFYHPLIQANGIVLDSALTLEISRDAVALGIEALDHSVEVAYSTWANDFVQEVTLYSVRLLSTYLPLTRKDPENLEYRTRLQVAMSYCNKGEKAH